MEISITIPVDQFWNAFGLTIPKPDNLYESIVPSHHNVKVYTNDIENGIDYYLERINGYGGAVLDIENNEVILTIKDPEAFAMEIMNTMNGYGFVSIDSFKDFKEGRPIKKVIENTFGWLAQRGEVYGGKSLDRILADTLSDERQFEEEDSSGYQEGDIEDMISSVNRERG